jgi:hypothetical protein
MALICEDLNHLSSGMKYQLRIAKIVTPPNIMPAWNSVSMEKANDNPIPDAYIIERLGRDRKSEGRHHHLGKTKISHCIETLY